MDTIKCDKCGEPLDLEAFGKAYTRLCGHKSAQVRMADETPEQTRERMRQMSRKYWDARYAIAKAKQAADKAAQELGKLKAENDADIKKTAEGFGRLKINKGG